jgi:hypothetical protein
MTKRDYIDFQDRTQPLAFLITFDAMELGCMVRIVGQLTVVTIIALEHQICPRIRKSLRKSKRR